MPTSSNGWSAHPGMTLRPLAVNGVAFVPGIRDNDDVETVLRYVMEQYAARVEPLHNPGCWGYNYRPNVNSPGSLSNHSSGTAVDANAPQHPNGVATLATFSMAQVSVIHTILNEVEHAVRWGGDYNGTPDAMHFEIDTDAATLAGVAERIGDDMPFTEAELTDIVRGAVRAELANAGETVKLDVGKPQKWSLTTTLKTLLNK